MNPGRTIILCPDGNPISQADLPPPDTTRWVWRRKAIVVAAVDGGLLSLEHACRRYRLTVEEFMAWKAGCAGNGYEALKVKSIQNQRPRRGMPQGHAQREART